MRLGQVNFAGIFRLLSMVELHERITLMSGYCLGDRVWFGDATIVMEGRVDHGSFWVFSKSLYFIIHDL